MESESETHLRQSDTALDNLNEKDWLVLPAEVQKELIEICRAIKALVSELRTITRVQDFNFENGKIVRSINQSSILNQISENMSQKLDILIVQNLTQKFIACLEIKKIDGAKECLDVAEKQIDFILAHEE